MQFAKSIGSKLSKEAFRSRKAVYGRQYGFDRYIRQMLKSEADAISPDTVAELYAHWGDPLTQNAESYLRSCLAEAARCEGPILQCGTSLLTLMLGVTCKNSGEEKAKHLWCLENDNHWANVIRSWLTQYSIGNAHVIETRAKMFEDYIWYAIDPTRLADKFSLVICEGARATPKGLIGVLERLEDKLASNCILLTRNVTKLADLKRINDWAKVRGATFVVVEKKEAFIKLSLHTQEPMAAQRQL